jgi:putative CocE/NonD family hydrolase
VDVRGRGNSEGTFRPFLQEAEDTHDVIEWLAAQPYTDGQVAMCGGSYNGYCQWAAAKNFPVHLSTIMPTAAPHLGTDFPMRNNIGYPYVVQWLTLVRERTVQEIACADDCYWQEIFHRWYRSGRPFKELDAIAGARSEAFQDWLQHPVIDSYWDAYNPTSEDYANIRLPVLTITGAYDDDQLGALTHYRSHVGDVEREDKIHYLVIGPWDHSGTHKPVRVVGGLELGPESVLDIKALQLEWCTWHLKRGPKPQFLKKPVAYYVTGEERWHYADSLSTIAGYCQSLFLDSAGRADAHSFSGSLSAEPGRGPPDSYCHDPRSSQSMDAFCGSQASSKSWVTDQGSPSAPDGKRLIYHTEPFLGDATIAGFFKLSVWLAIDCPDTDFYVSVYEIQPDARSIRLTSDAMRARYRSGLRGEVLINTREALRYDFERFTFVARRISAGSRLRLIIAPEGRLIDAPFTQRNFNGGGCVAEESVESARAVNVILFHDAGRPSMLEVPYLNSTEQFSALLRDRSDMERGS